MRGRSGIPVLAVVIGASAAGAAVPRSSATAVVPETCQGQPATIVGDGTSDVVGTEGPDVIVARGRYVHALGGDDVICVRGDRTTVVAGEGRDSVTVEGDGSAFVTRAILGPGDDAFVGGPGPDLVTDVDPNAGDDYQGASLPDSGDDSIRTLGGDDSVEAGGRVGPAQTDVVDLGPGDDVLRVGLSGTTTASRLLGGTGRNELLQYAAPGRRMALDLARRTSTVDTRVLARGWSGFQRFSVENNVDASGYLDEEQPRSVTVRGSAASEVVQVLAAVDENAGGAVLDVALGPGDDTLATQVFNGGRASGGDGRDRLVVNTALTRSTQTVRLDLLQGRVSLPGLRPLAVSRFQDASIVRGNAGDARSVLVGDGDANRLDACGTIRGGGGNDLLRETAGRPTRCGLLRAYGGPGADRMVGSLGGNHLDGGPGRDTAIGLAGIDRCVAERRVSCERR